METLYEAFLDSAGICTDSRNAAKNMIFFALKGASFDGNRFAGDALERGCKLAVTDNPDAVKGKNYFLVDDVLETMQNLALFHRKKLDIPIIAITGSNGKTTTKELIHSVLSRNFNTLSTEGNLNNHIGVPLTILKIRDQEIAVIEMGANHPGEIAFLCRIALPGYGIITNIGKAHLEGFGSFEGVKKTKSELYHYLSEAGGIAFVNGSNEILAELSSNENLRKVYYMGGNNSLCDGQIIENVEEMRVAVRFPDQGRTLETKTGITGAYNLENILAAACIGSYFGISPEEIAAGLGSYKSRNNRSQFLTTKHNQVILDAYNANPTSMLKAIQNFLTFRHNHKVLILGDMLELGKYSEPEHENLLREISKNKFMDVFLVGNEFFRFKNRYGYKYFLSTGDLIEHLSNRPVKDSLVLIKGSRGIALEKIFSVL